MEATLVQIIRRKNDLTLVQWEKDDRYHRAWIVPSMIAEQVDADHLTVYEPHEGVPYGEDWAALFTVNQVTPERIDRELKRKGIWTVEDLRGSPDLARRILQRVYGLDMAALLSRAAQIEGGTP